MKIGIITDLHIGHYPEKPEEFREFVSTLRCDILIISGDISSNDPSQTEKAFKIIREVDPYLKVLVVEGNHDYWSISPFKTLDEVINEFTELCRKYDIHYLQEMGEYVEDTVVIMGYDGWYAFRDSGTNDYEMMPQKNSFGASTFDVMKKREQDGLDKVLQQVEKYPNKVKICVTHFTFWTTAKKYERMCGNKRHFDLFLKDSFDYLIVGHSHQPQREKFDNCTVINAGADYEQCPRLDLFYEEIIID